MEEQPNEIKVSGKKRGGNKSGTRMNVVSEIIAAIADIIVSIVDFFD